MRIPKNTYRLQVTADFDLFEAARRLPYLHDLGVDWVYLSPLLAAEPGSAHGYDVVAHDRIDPARGGEEGLTALSKEARRLGMGVLVDIVPNHVGVATPAENAWWWDLLKHGQDSTHAAAFDVDWAAGDGKIRIPVVGDGDEASVQVADGEVRYHEMRFPLAPGTTSPDEQHYEQSHAEGRERLLLQNVDRRANGTIEEKIDAEINKKLEDLSLQISRLQKALEDRDR